MIWLLWLVSVVMVIVDQLVKRWAYTSLRLIGEKPFIPGLLGFTYTENQGAAFGMLQGGRWFFVPLTLLIVGVIIYYYIRLPRERIYLAARIPMVFIVAGAVGNFIDRAFNGYVVDMFEFKFIQFPIFNVADICLVCGTLALSFVLLFVMKDTAWK